MQLTEFGAELGFIEMALYREALLWAGICMADSVRNYEEMIASPACTQEARDQIAPLLEAARQRRRRFKDGLDHYDDVMNGRTVVAADYKELPA